MGDSHRLEYVWIGIVVAMLAGFTLILAYASEAKGYGTPDSAVTCDVKKLEEQITPGIRQLGPGIYEVNLVGAQWSWNPNRIVLENPKKIIFRITSADVLHGFEIVGTSVNVMVMPGYIAEVEWIPPEDLEGDLLIVCNEYCGLAHHQMKATLTIVRG